MNFSHDISGDGGHDSDGANGDVFRRSEEPVDEDTHEGRIETEFHGQIGQFGVGHTLRYNNSTNGQT